MDSDFNRAPVAAKQMDFVTPDTSITSKEHFIEFPFTPIQTRAFLAPVIQVSHVKAQSFDVLHETKETEKY